jgi:TolB-like protein/tetratricopeptide (TPR) repeat protein
MQATGWFHNLYEELKHRRVIRVATLYVVALWPLIQIVDILSPAIGLPGSSMRTLLFIFVGGFPVALVLAWVFDLNTSGITRHTDNEASQKKHALIGRNTEFLIVGTLLVIVIVLFVVQINMTPLADSSVVVSNTSPVASADLVNSTESNIQSIAVLPFAIFSKNQQDEYFADGLTEELLNMLSRIRNLRVAARTSSFAYKGVSKNIQIIGNELNVGTILEGSVRRNDVDDTIRVTAQLIDVASGAHLWSQTFDREFRDIFKIQDEITASVVSHLKVTLMGDETEKIKSHASASPEAMVAYSMGRTELAKRTKTALQDAIRFFKKAIEQDANYSEAYSGLADAYTLLLNYGDQSVEAHLVKAQEAVDKALELGPTLGSAWASQGLIYMHQDNKKDAARSALKKAMELNPSYAMAYMWYGNLAETREEKIQLHRKAFELDPRSPVAGYNVANDLIEDGREAEAMDIFSRIVEADPYYPGAYRLVAGINEYNGRLGEAILQYKKVFELEENSKSASRIAKLYIDLGDFDNADIWIDSGLRLAPDANKAELTWLTFSSQVARGNRAKAKATLTSMMKVSGNNSHFFYDASYAAFLLGDFEATVSHFESGQELHRDMEMPYKRDNATDASIGAAFAYRQLNQNEKADKLLEDIDTKLDKLIKSSVRLDPQTWYRKAEISAMQGNQHMSLVHLQRAVDQGFRQHWRPLIDPALANVLADTYFQTMMSLLADSMNEMRETLAFEESFRDNWKG